MKKFGSILLAVVLTASLLAGCSSSSTDTSTSTDETEEEAEEEVEEEAEAEEEAEESTSSDVDESETIYVAGGDYETLDVQLTSADYDIPLNIFDRLFEIELLDDGSTQLVNSLVEDYSVSDDGLTYTFKLKEGIEFSNGEALTASDVYYTFYRNLTITGGVNYDFVNVILGAEELYNGETDTLEGFNVIDDYNFEITLSMPFGGFVYQLATPACSIYDETSTEAAGDDFGIDPEVTIGSGPYKVESWDINSGMVLVLNENYWGETPDVEKVVMTVYGDSNTKNMAYQNGELDIIDLDSLDSSIVESTYQTTYADQIVSVSRVALTYLTFNENLEPFNDVNVRKAIQMAIDRQTILDTVYAGNGNVEDGIFPRGLVAHNEDLEGTITYDPEAAKELLAEAGYADGFEMELASDSSASDSVLLILQIIQQELEEIGITANIQSYDESAWLDLRKSGEMSSFVATWTADYNDPDNFIYTFFGTEDKTKARSLNYPDTDVMQQVNDARGIVDEDERVATYQDLEYKIVIEDAAWLPLFSREHLFAISEKIETFVPFWSGYSSIQYANVTLAD